MREIAPARTRLSQDAAARFKGRMVDEYVNRHSRSRELHMRAQAAFPGGDTRTVTYFGPFPVYVERGRGCRLYDADGHTLLDLLGNYTSIIWGHAHPRIVEAARAQIERGTGFAAPTESQAILAGMLRDRLPSMERVRFANSGTEANMHAIRAARAFTGRDKIVKMEGGYHGSYDAVEISVHPDLAAAGPMTRPAALPDTRGIPASEPRDVLVAPFNDVDAIEAIVREHQGEIAAVIVEPVPGVMGTIPPREGFLPALRRLTEEMGIVLIFDEVIAFRLGYHGAQGRYNVRPDLTVLGKIIGGGFPAGAFGGRADIMRLYDPGRPGAMVQSGTFNANPVTVAAGIAGMELLSAAEFERINRLGDELRGGLQSLFDGAGVAARVTGVGSLLTVLFTDRDIVNYRDAATVDRDLTEAFHLAWLNHGLFSATRGMMAVSLAMGADEVAEALTATRAALDMLASVR